LHVLVVVLIGWAALTVAAQTYKY